MIRPAFITYTLLQSAAMTPMSWLTTRREVPVSSTIRFRRWRIWTWTAASRAVVGSSAMITRGSQARAMAMATLWRIPPDSSNGYCPIRSFGERIPAISSSSSARSFASRLVHFLWIRTVSVICRPIFTAGFRQFRESWRIMAISRPGCTGSAQTVIPSEETSALSPRSPITASIAVLFPEPDSPTMPTVSPSPTEKLIPSSACLLSWPV